MEEKTSFRNKHVSKKKTKEQPDYFLFVTLSQCLICAFVFVLLLLLSRGESARAVGLRSDFQLMLSRQLQMQDVIDTVGTIRNYFLPQEGVAAVMAQPDEVTTLPETVPAETVVPDEEALEQTQPTTEPTQTVATQSLRTAGSAVQKSAAKNVGDSVPKKKKTVVSASSVSVPITRPVDGGRYSSYYGYRNNPITHQYALHTGLDIAVPEGTEIRAAYGGTVRQVGEDSRSGKYVTITHDDGYETFYCHCSKTAVREGTFVNAGDVIACVGSTGWATGPHLHFEIRKNGEKIDPLTMLEHDV